jgi:D-beta-D-heptose 7-phosphate kinase/D-beta-D-heptose 1-phosphate adenosyltransferase
VKSRKPVRARDKILRPDALVRRVARARARGERIVFTNGCFDLLHTGHLHTLEQARRLGDRLVVAVNADASVRRAKGPERPVRRTAQRMELVAGLACVDWVVAFAADTPIRLIERIRPDVLAKGADWALEAIVGAEEVRSWGGRVVRIELVRGESTTRELERISKPARRAPREARLRRNGRPPAS